MPEPGAEAAHYLLLPIVLWALTARINPVRLKQRVTQAGWLKAHRALTRFAARWEAGEPTAEQVEEWAITGP
jgi:hypothetical protein